MLYNLSMVTLKTLSLFLSKLHDIYSTTIGSMIKQGVGIDVGSIFKGYSSCFE